MTAKLAQQVKLPEMVVKKMATISLKVILDRRVIDPAKPTIAFAHDSRFFLDLVIEKMAKGNVFNIVHCENAKKVLHLFHTNVVIQSPNLVISDLRLPHGGVFTEAETDQGFNTGLALYHHLRRVQDKDLAVIIFTTDKPAYHRMKEIQDPRLRVISVDNNLSELLTMAIEELFPQAG